MIKYRPHKLSGSREFQSGIPGDWPQVEEEVPDSRKLTADEVSAGFSLITSEEHQQIRTSNRTAYNAWLAAQKATEDSDLPTKRTDINDAITSLRQIRDSSGTLTGVQLSNAVRVLAKAMLWLMERARELFER